MKCQTSGSTIERTLDAREPVRETDHIVSRQKAQARCLGDMPADKRRITRRAMVDNWREAGWPVFYPSPLQSPGGNSLRHIALSEPQGSRHNACQLAAAGQLRRSLASLRDDDEGVLSRRAIRAQIVQDRRTYVMRWEETQTHERWDWHNGIMMMGSVRES
jgi:hypothetical protein